MHEVGPLLHASSLSFPKEYTSAATHFMSPPQVDPGQSASTVQAVPPLCAFSTTATTRPLSELWAMTSQPVARSCSAISSSSYLPVVASGGSRSNQNPSHRTSTLMVGLRTCAPRVYASM